MNRGATYVLAAGALVLSFTTTATPETSPDQTPPTPTDNVPLGGGKPVTTKVIKRCSDGRELVLRADGRYGCAKDVVPPNY
jgi:hypothetical protein